MERCSASITPPSTAQQPRSREARSTGCCRAWPGRLLSGDGQGSTRQLLDSSQVTQASYITDAYGNSVSSTGTATNPLKWNGGSGYYSDGESGLQKVGARYYEPATGRWLTQDTLIIAGSPFDSQAINRYLYCDGNAAGRIDPSGKAMPAWAAEVVEAIIDGAKQGLAVRVAGTALVLGGLIIWRLIIWKKNVDAGNPNFAGGDKDSYLHQQQNEDDIGK